MNDPYVNIHTHRPTGRGIELRAEGIHPWQAEATAPGNLPALTAAAQAVGEIGLDYARATDRGAQLRLLREQLDLAERTGLPVVLHCVRAFEPLMKELQGRRLKAGIFPGFIGSPEVRPADALEPEPGDAQILGGARQGVYPHFAVSGGGARSAVHHEHLDGRRTERYSRRPHDAAHAV